MKNNGKDVFIKVTYSALLAISLLNNFMYVPYELLSSFDMFSIVEQSRT